MNIDAKLEQTLMGKIREEHASFKLDHPKMDFKFENLEYESQQELLWCAFEEYVRQDTLNQWEYLEEFDVAGFVRSLLHGPHGKFPVFDMYAHVKQYFAEVINQEIEELNL